MEIMWYVLQLAKPIAALGVAFFLPRCFIPLKKGILSENQKLINKGCAYLIGAVASFVILIYLFKVVG